MRKHPVLSLTLLLLVLSQAGCVDLVREGITGGVSEGVENVISDMIEDLILGVIDS